MHWTDRSIYIYGTGSFARAIFSVMKNKDITIKGFLDHLPRQIKLNDRPVCKPEDLPSDQRAAAVVILGIHNREANCAAIMANLESLGYSRTITPVELYDDFVYELGNRYWLTQRNFYQAYKVEIETTARLFSDQASRDLFDAILSFRSSGDYRLLPEPAMQRQYFPVDIPAWKTPLRLVDCGAYDGDTLRSISALGISLDALAAFEPDEINFQKLAEAVRQGRIPNAHLWPCGVYSATCKLHFSQGYGEASGIAMQGDATVQCLSLDDAIPSFAPTLIKMDIEGAEPEALTGAKSIIATYKPGLALSIYHAPAHLWEIPLWVSQFAKQNNIPYRYFLRAHGHNGFDTIFYTV